MEAHGIKALQKLADGDGVGFRSGCHSDLVVREHDIVYHPGSVKLFADVFDHLYRYVVVETELSACEWCLPLAETAYYGCGKHDGDFPRVVFRHAAQIAEEIIAQHILEGIGEHASEEEYEPR